ncbi:MAG: hypothetical protein WKG00_08770 [Polyangiaceae bacterium]
MPRTDVALRALVVACAFGAGCSLIAGLEEHGPLPDGSQGGDGGGGDGGQGGTCDGGVCPGCAGKIVYVSTSGDDASDGCTAAAPKKTVSGALGYVKTVGAIDHEIRVCKGTYSETQIVVDYPVKLMGGYECTSWKRTPTYGFPAFDEANDTRLEKAAPYPGATATVVVRGAEVGPDVVIDGFTVVGAVESRSDSAGVLIEEGARPTLSNDVILGGAGPARSAALDIIGGARPDIQRCSLRGGAAVFTFGVSVVDSLPHLHENQIVGGKGEFSGTGIGIDSGSARSLDAPSGTAVELNDIFGNQGNGTSVGVSVSGLMSVELRRNRIDGGQVTGGVTARAVFASTSGTMTLHDNRIFAGTRGFGLDAPPTELVGVYLEGTNESEIVNNMIHGGDINGAGETYGIKLVEADGAFVAHNTMFAGVSESATATFVEHPLGLVMQNNLLAGGGGAGYGLVLVGCDGSLASLENNAFVHHGGGVAFVRTRGACPSGAMPRVKDAEALLPIGYPAAVVENNVAVVADCVDEAPSTCADVNDCAPASQTCLQSIFAAWTASKAGFPELLLPDGWGLGDPSHCAISEGGRDLSSTVAVDALGVPRTAPVSIGARELDTACTR